MSNEPSKARFFGWLAGLAIAALAGYLVWYYTEPKPPPPPPPPPAVTTLQGMVYSGSKPVAKAMVAVQLTGAASAVEPVYDITDGNGAYRFDIAGLPSDAGATLIVRATGYETPEPRSIAGPLEADVRADFSLEPVPRPGSASTAPSAGAQGGKTPAYVEKSAGDVIHVKIPPQQ